MKLRYKFAIGLLAIVTTGTTALALAMSYTAACEPMTKLTEDGEQMHAVLATAMAHLILSIMPK